MSAINQRFAEPLSVLEQIGPVLEDGHGLLAVDSPLDIPSSIYVRRRRSEKFLNTWPVRSP